MKRIVITVEVYDESTVSDVEEAIGTGLSDKGIDCIYNVEDEVMISKEMIKAGFKSGAISIEDTYAGCLGICCRIGGNAFYFAGSEAETLTKEEYWKTFSMNDTIDMLYNILKTADSAEDNGICEEEYDYYRSVLTS